MRIIEFLKLLLENKDLFFQLMDLIREFFPTGAQPVVFTLTTAEKQFPELAAACAEEGLTLEDLIDAIQESKE